MLESLLWRYLKALLSGCHDICIVCVLLLFAIDEQPDAELDLISKNTQEESKGTESKGSIMLEFARKLLALSNLIDSSFKLMVILPANVVLCGGTSSVVSNRASDYPHFHDCVRDDE